MREQTELESFFTRHSLWMALIVVLVVSTLGYLLDVLLVIERVPRAYMLLFTNTLTGVVAGGLFFQMVKHEKAQREMMRARMATIAAMNHHIRNALQVIKVLGTNPNDHASNGEQIQLINESVERVEWALREVLPKYPAGSEDLNGETGGTGDRVIG
jgi:hypothetical protein